MHDRSVAHWAFGILAAAVLLAFPPAAWARASVLISPIDPAIEAGQTATALWLENRGDASVTLQVRIFQWSQPAGEDSYDGQAAIAASPPLVRIAPGGRQLVRLTEVSGGRPAGETAYRIILDELPDPTGAAEASGSPAIQFQMRYTLPLFVDGGAPESPELPDAPVLTCTIVGVGPEWSIEMQNGGARHARLTQAAFTGDGQSVAVGSGLLGYVLPGGVMRWPLPQDAPQQGSLSVVVNGNGAPETLPCAGA